jgi:hypothetical protein
MENQLALPFLWELPSPQLPEGEFPSKTRLRRNQTLMFDLHIQVQEDFLRPPSSVSVEAQRGSE